jgi:hypothetical protein
LQTLRKSINAIRNAPAALKKLTLSPLELILCVAKSWKWYQALSKGKVRSVQELAALEKTSVETITRNLPLAVLKPGQVEKLLKGQHTPDLSVAQLLKAPSLL